MKTDDARLRTFHAVQLLFTLFEDHLVIEDGRQKRSIQTKGSEMNPSDLPAEEGRSALRSVSITGSKSERHTGKRLLVILQEVPEQWPSTTKEEEEEEEAAVTS